MKSFLIAGALFALAATAAQAQSATPSAPICLRGVDIRETRSPDNRTIIFHMNDGSVYRNDLRNDCPLLTFNGFAYVATPPDQICGNLQSIRVLQSGAVCMLGPFTKVTPAIHN